MHYCKNMQLKAEKKRKEPLFEMKFANLVYLLQSQNNKIKEMNMKKVFIIVFCIVFLTSCGNLMAENTDEDTSYYEEDEKSKDDPIEELNESEKIVFDTILEHKNEWVNPSSIRVMEVKDFCYEPDADPEQMMHADLIVVQIEGENNYGGTMASWYIFSLSDRNSFMSNHHAYTSKTTSAVLLSYSGKEGAYEEIEDIDEFYETSHLLTDRPRISEKKINAAFEEYWEKKY